MIRELPQIQHVTEQYSQIHAAFLARSEGIAQPTTPIISNSHGFYLSQPNYALTSRFASLDKLFYTLVMGIVDDPDFAVQKDSKIYEKMMRDPQIFYCLYVRKAAINSLPWTISPPTGKELDSAAQNVAAACEARLRQIPRFAELLDNVQDALLPGLSINELVWQLDGNGRYIVHNHYPVNKDRVKFDKAGNLYLLSPKQPTIGELCPSYKFIAHHFNITDGSWKQPETGGYTYYGRGLADTPLYHYFYFKMMALKFMMKELERYGLPFKVLYTGPQNQAMADKMAEMMACLKNDSVVVIPGKKGDVVVDLLSANRSGNMFALFINYIDSLITKTILGQELMTEMPGVGSYAAAAVHKSVFGLINEQDRLLVDDTLNHTLVRFDMQLNMPTLKEEYYPVFGFKKSPVEDVVSFLTTAKLATELGVPVSVRQVREFTGLRAPSEGEEILQLPEPIMQPPEEQVPTKGKPGQSKPKDKSVKPEPKKYALKVRELTMQALKCPDCGKTFERPKQLRRTVIACPACGALLTFDKGVGAKLIKHSEPEEDDDDK